MENPVLMNAYGMQKALGNLCTNECTIADIYDAVEDSANGEELAEKLNALPLLNKFELDRETQKYARLRSQDAFGNMHYFYAYK